ncbi:unnamed protein product [Mucor fragilis]
MHMGTAMTKYVSYRQTFDMGTTNLTEKEIEDLLLQLSDEFTGPSYNLLSRNCNHFTEEFVLRLTQKTIPAWINRAAKLGNMFPCVVPWEWIQPPELAEEAEEEVAEEEEEADDDDDDDRHVQSRRPSTISLLSSRRTRSNYTYSSAHDGRNSSQERLILGGNHGGIYHPPIAKFQGIVYGDQQNLPSSSSSPST